MYWFLNWPRRWWWYSSAARKRCLEKKWAKLRVSQPERHRRQAREVHDRYLSRASPEPPRRNDRRLPSTLPCRE